MNKLIVRLVAAMFALCSALAFSANEVKLWKVNSIVQTRGFSVQNVRFEVLVANLAFQKQVVAHLRRWDGAWVDVPLSFNRAANNNYELWSGTYSVNTSVQGQTFDPRFAIRYVVGGQTYWDNNNGQDYTIARDSGTRLIDPGVNVYDEFHTANANIGLTQTTYGGAVTVRNIAFAKQVQVYYSTDNWNTVQIANGSYSPSFWASAYSSAPNPNQYGFEDWSYQLNIGNANQVVYAIAYTVGGQTYWDNNFGNNYRITFTRL